MDTVSSNPLSKRSMGWLRRMKKLKIARVDQAGGLPVGKSGYIMDSNLNLACMDKYKGRKLTITDPEQKILGHDINMVLITDDPDDEGDNFDRHHRITAKMAMFPSFWDDDFFLYSYDPDELEGDHELMVYVAAASLWASSYVYDTLINSFSDDPERLADLLVVLAFGYLNQYSIYFNLEECDHMNKAFEDLGFFVEKHCNDFLQERYAQVMAKREERRAKRTKTVNAAACE